MTTNRKSRRYGSRRAIAWYNIYRRWQQRRRDAYLETLEEEE